MEEKKTPPVKIGDKLRLGVIRMGNNGDPVMVHKGFIIFLKIGSQGFQLNTLMDVKIIKVFPKFAFCEGI